jgi:serine/threonine-protein kinase
MSYADAVRRLTAAGFGKVKQVLTASTPEQKDRVVSTSPPANQTAPVTFEISVNVGSGPEMVDVPDVAGQSEDQARSTLTAAQFTNIVSVPTDSPKQAGTVLATIPPAGQSVPKDAVIQIQVSKGNQFVMPDLTGMFWTDVEPLLRGTLGWTGNLIKGADVQGTDQQKARVVYQNPAAGAGINRDGNVTLRFGAP